MNKQMFAVMKRRSELLARIAIQREQMAEVGASFQSVLAMADRAVAVVRVLRSHPVLIASAAVLILARCRRAAGALGLIWRAWKRFRYITERPAKLSS